MDTVQLQCGHCQQVIAIGTGDLGKQVECPHCKGVLQTPPPPEAPSAEASAEQTPPASLFTDAPPSSESTPAPSVPDTELPQFKPRPVYDRGVFTMYALIFLVPYAILTTLGLVYFIFLQPPQQRIHPFDMLPDPAPTGKQGGPKKAAAAGLMVDPLSPLADHQKVEIGKSITVGKDGDLVATPEKVRLTSAGDLQLFLKAKNASKNSAFAPINEFYVKYDMNKDGPFPYTHVETRSGRFAGVYLNYRKNLTDEDEGRDSLGPGEETILRLETYEHLRKDVAALAKAEGGLTWRVRLRRGFVKYHGKDASATAVIGVEFTSAQIERSN